MALQGVPGVVYMNAYYIERTGQRWQLVLANTCEESDSLDVLEDLLFDYAVQEGSVTVED